jgi:hypothetical protein
MQNPNDPFALEKLLLPIFRRQCSIAARIKMREQFLLYRRLVNEWCCKLGDECGEYGPDILRRAELTLNESNRLGRVLLIWRWIKDGSP